MSLGESHVREEQSVDGGLASNIGETIFTMIEERSVAGLESYNNQ
jgi:hypothetical protein